MKKRLLLNIATLLSVLTVVSSCSVGDVYIDDDISGEPSNTLIITGTVSDLSNGEPLEDIQITLTATELYDSQDGRIVTKSTYTNNKGQYALAADGFSRPVTCTLNASDKKGIYKDSAPQEVMVSWKGTAYDSANSIFNANGCDFYLEKK